jgi:hypothetical protein
MKKLLLLSAILLGAVSASHAGVRFNVGVGLPLPPLPGVVIGQPAPPVYAAVPPACYPPPVYYSEPAVVVGPPSVYLGFGPYYGRGWYGHRYHHYYGGWDHHYRGGHHGWHR